MRMRPKPWALDELNNNPFVIKDMKELKNPSALFGNDYPVHVEIGMGKGDFIVGTAADKRINFIGIERQKDVCAIAARKVRESSLTNIRICYGDAILTDAVLEADSIDQIYLNFSDPWPKNRCAKHRLTHRNFLSKYRRFIKTDGLITLKTDSRGLFIFSFNEFIKNGLTIKNVAFDLHGGKYPDNVMSEYERKFFERGIDIYRIIAQF